MTAATRGVIPTLTAGQRLMIAREYAGLSQGDLAEMIGVSNATIYRAEAGNKASRRTLMAWAMATGVDLAWLETGNTPAGPDGHDEGGECPQQGSNLRPADYKSVVVPLWSPPVGVGRAA